MDKPKLHSPDLTQSNIERLAELFPGCVTEARDDNGKLKKAIDFDQLRQELSDNIVEGPQERYHLNWPGKREALLAANAPIAKTLRPCREESVDFDTTKNLFIEGDNLDALKLLQETYLNKVKMIYIDPPYNTGKDRIYLDDFSEDSESYFLRSQQRSENGSRLVTNNETNGRFHSDWLSMLFPRLRIARDLLTKDGAIFISIGDHEVHNIKHLCDEVLGRQNFLAQFVWRTDGNFDNQAKVKFCHEYIICYARNIELFPHPPVVDPGTGADSKLFKDKIRNTIIKNGPKNPVSSVTLPAGFPASFDSGVIVRRSDSWPNYQKDARVRDARLENAVSVSSGWSSKELLSGFIANECNPVEDNKGQETRFEVTQTGAIEAIKKRADAQSHVISVIGGMGGSQKAASELEELRIPFDDYPKPTQLIKYFIKMQNSKDCLIVDFFAGSCTTAHSVFQINSEDGGTRRVISCQLPEQCAPGSRASEGGYKTIADIGKQRIRNAGEKVVKESNADQLDVGFRVLKTDTSNMKNVYYTPDAITQDDLYGQIDNIKPGRSGEDLLFQVMLDWGLDLALPISAEKIAGKTVYFVDGDDLAACFETGIDEAFVKELAQRKPLRAVFRDTGYGSDNAKINVAQIFRLISPSTDVKSI